MGTNLPTEFIQEKSTIVIMEWLQIYGIEGVLERYTGWYENKDTFRNLIKEYEPLFGKKFRDKEGKKYKFDSISFDGEDVYYTMIDNKGKAFFLSCVGNINTIYEQV